MSHRSLVDLNIHRMKTALALGVPLFLILLVLSVFIDTGATRLLGNSYLSQYQTNITCLEYDLDISGNATIQKFCAETPDVKIVSQDIVYQRTSHLLEIDKLAISLIEKDTPSPIQSIELPVLAENLPQIIINQIEIHSTALERPITFALHQNGKNQFTLENGWQIHLTLADKRLSARLIWRANDVATDLPDFDLKDIPSSLRTQTFASDMQFDGDLLSVSQPLAIQSEIRLSDCPVDFLLNGTATIHYRLSESSGVMDLTALETKARIKTCDVLDTLPINLPDKSFELTIPDRIKIKQNTLTIPLMTLYSDDEKWLNLTAENTSIVGVNDIHSQLSLAIELEKWLFIESQAEVQHFDKNIIIDSGLAKLRITKKQYESLNIEELMVESQFSLKQTEGLKLSTNTSLSKIENNGVSAANITSTAKLKKPPNLPLSFDVQASIPEVVQGDILIENLQPSFTGTVNDNRQLTAKGQSQIAGIQVAQVNLGSFSLNHNVKAGFHQNVTSSSQHQIFNDLGFKAELTHLNSQVSAQLPRQTIVFATPLLQQFSEQLTLTNGEIDGQLDYDLGLAKGAGFLNLDKISGKMEQYLFNGLTYSPQFTVDSAKLQLTPSKLIIDNLFTGIVIDNVNGVIQSQGQEIIAQDIKGNLLGGTFELDKVALNPEDQTFNLGLDNINLAALLQIQESAGVQGPGITVSGNIGGNIPLKVSQGDISVDDGQLANLGPGWLKIRGNAAFNSLKQSQPEISSQLSVLENLQYDTLTSSLSMQPDGLVNLNMQIQGTNPDVNEKINFNYSHEQNVFTLLKSLRLADEIKNKVDDALSDDKSG